MEGDELVTITLILSSDFFFCRSPLDLIKNKMKILLEKKKVQRALAINKRPEWMKGTFPMEKNSYWTYQAILEVHLWGIGIILDGTFQRKPTIYFSLSISAVSIMAIR